MAVNEPKNTAEAANVTVPMPPAPGPATPQSGGVQTESGWRDAIAPAIHDLIAHQTPGGKTWVPGTRPGTGCALGASWGYFGRKRLPAPISRCCGR